MKYLITLTSVLVSITLSAQPLNKPKVALHNWAIGLDEPVAITNCGDSRMFVVERDGRIKIISDSMVVETRPFLNISGPVHSGGGEQGMLGLAFEPDYLTSGYFYVYYIAGTGSGTSRISRFSVSNDPDSADVASEQILWQRAQPFSNHNGGDLHFGPDGYLYLSLGDGGSANDPQGHGQNYTTALGAMIRIDVSEHNDSYLIPPSNPFSFETGTDTLPEIWAVGLRNPYRWSFDRLTGDVWIGDVGQNAWEEFDFWPAGDNSCPNFGWRCREGLVTNNSVSQANCQGASAYVSPFAVLSNIGIGGNSCSGIGGYVYRGSWYPHHYGYYIFTDYCAGDFLTYATGLTTGVDTMLMTTTTGYAGFGEDLDGQLYVVDQSNNLVKKLYDPCRMDDPIITSNGTTLTATTGTSYQWYLNGAVIAGATAATYTPTASGVYQVRVNFGTPCNLWSATNSFSLVGVPEEMSGRVAVFPQPAKDLVTLERAVAHSAANVFLFDAVGRSVLTTTWASGQSQLAIDVAALRVGSYVLRYETVDGSARSSTPLLIAR